MVAGHEPWSEFFELERGDSLANERKEALSREGILCSVNILRSAGTEKTRNIQAASATAHNSVCENLYVVSKGCVMSSG
jgi:hypothetical protein